MKYAAHTWYMAAALLVIYLINGLFYLPRQSLTFDEPRHFAFGVRMLHGSTERTDVPAYNSKMPISVLNVLPRAAEQVINKELKKTDNGISDIVHGRYVTLFISLLIGFVIFKWASELYGEKAGIFSLFLFSFCPNCLAHAALVSTDTYSQLVLLLVMYYLWRYLSAGGTRKDLILFCFFTGIAQIVKQSLFHLYVIIPLVLIVWHFAGDRRRVEARELWSSVGVFAVINLLVINAGFYFQGFGKPLSDYHFISGLFSGVQRHLGFLARVPLPLPSSFVEGLDMAKYYENLGGGLPQSMFANVTLLGQSKTQGTFWYFYFVICFFKTPIAVLVFFGWSFVQVVRKGNWRSFVWNELFLLLPVVYFFILLDFFYKSQTNIRHIIFIYPLLYVLCGVIVRRPGTARYRRPVLAGLSAWYVLSVLTYFGNYLPYTNEFIPDKTNAYRIIGAENLNMNQGRYFLRDYLAAHPAVTMAGPTPRAGRQAIAVSDYLDVWNEHKYDWLKPLKPVGHIAHAYLLFDVGADQLPPP